MFFDRLGDVRNIAVRSGTSIFVVPDYSKILIDDAIILQPEEKASITIDQVRDVIACVDLKQANDVFVVIRPAEKMSLEAANSFLKNLEEPSEKIHFVLITNNPSALLPTILSRSAIYVLKQKNSIQSIACKDEKVKAFAKQLLTARQNEIIDLAEKISKQKNGARGFALSVIGVAIEMLYKTFLINQREIFLQKLPKFLAVYDGLERNGSIKLQIVANLL